MDKKNLKLYEAPALEVVEFDVQAPLLEASIEQPEWAPSRDDYEY